MRIVLLANNLRVAGGLSVGKNIVSHLPKLAPKHQYLIVVPEGCDYPDFINEENVSVLKCPPVSIFKRYFWEKKHLVPAVKRFKPDWIWALGNFPLETRLCRQSVLFHNAHRVYPDISKAGCSFSMKIFKWLSDVKFRRSLKFADRIYCQTETIKSRLLNLFNFRGSIELCPNAFSFGIKKGDAWPSELEKYRGKFILFVLTKYYKHKNLEIILDVFHSYRQELSDVICVIPLDSKQGVPAANFINKVKELGLENNIVCTGTIPQERLGEYFLASDVMFLPTLLESFSGTYLESMQLDRPILTSDRDFAREICGEAAHFIDPLSIDSIRDGILKLKNDSIYRNELTAKGKERIKKHLKTWPEILRDVLDTEGIEHN